MSEQQQVHLTSAVPSDGAKTALSACPACDGGGVVLDLRRTPPKRLLCGTCAATGKIDAGVWPYEPWPKAEAQ